MRMLQREVVLALTELAVGCVKLHTSAPPPPSRALASAGLMEGGAAKAASPSNLAHDTSNLAHEICKGAIGRALGGLREAAGELLRLGEIPGDWGEIPGAADDAPRRQRGLRMRLTASWAVSALTTSPVDERRIDAANARALPRRPDAPHRGRGVVVHRDPVAADR